MVNEDERDGLIDLICMVALAATMCIFGLVLAWILTGGMS